MMRVGAVRPSARFLDVMTISQVTIEKGKTTLVAVIKDVMSTQQ